MSETTQNGLAMQYSFTLPADYDMAIIERRIAEKGPALDGLPGLRLKAYLSARRGAENPENLYAPFYVWNEPAALSDFLVGRGFAGLVDAFGWPTVRTWVVWRARFAAGVQSARFATRATAPIAAHSPLAALKTAEAEAVDAALAEGALAAVAGFEPTSWTCVRFRLWRDPPKRRDDETLYDVGHVSLGAPSEKGL